MTSTQQASYSFDSNGNVTSKSDSNGKWYYFYDRENRLTNATKFGGMMPRAGQSVSYNYDALGRRVSRQDKKSGKTEFTHDGLDVIQDRFQKSDGTNSTTSYVNGLGIDNKLKVTSGTTSKYFLTDHLGSTTGLTDSNGNVTESASYDSFGNKTGTLSTRYGYTGREQDEATGLMYYRARFYDSQVGRFTSEDPIGFAGGDVNLHGYVWNDPLNWIDPLGLIGESDLRADRNRYRRNIGDMNEGNWGPIGALGDFFGNYNDMREANTIGADKFFHCMANCEASKRGFWGYFTAWSISESRELYDQYVKGDPETACNEDRYANQIGRWGGQGSQPCTIVCLRFRPNGLVYPRPKPIPAPTDWKKRSWGGGGRGW